MNQRTTLRDLAPWAVLVVVAISGLLAKSMGADPALFQLLSTIAGVCGGALLPRQKMPDTTTTVTSGDPPSTVTTGPST